MTRLLVLLAVSLVLAYISEQNTSAITAAGHRYTVWKDWAYILLVLVLTLFAGLKVSYNDTGNYIEAFYRAPGVTEWLSNPKNYNLFTNPPFYVYESAINILFRNNSPM